MLCRSVDGKFKIGHVCGSLLMALEAHIDNLIHFAIVFIIVVLVPFRRH